MLTLKYESWTNFAILCVSVGNGRIEIQTFWRLICWANTLYCLLIHRFNHSFIYSLVHLRCIYFGHLAGWELQHFAAQGILRHGLQHPPGPWVRLCTSHARNLQAVSTVVHHVQQTGRQNAIGIIRWIAGITPHTISEHPWRCEIRSLYVNRRSERSKFQRINREL